MQAQSHEGRRAEEQGASAAEYALLITLIAVAILAGLTAFGISVNDMFDRSCDDVSSATGGSAC